MAQVVLENICKSFPARPGERQPMALADSTLAAPGTLPQIPKTASEIAASSSNSKATSILKQINLTIADGEFMVLVGPSGCGKSTLLRLIAGLETPTAGSIWVGDRCVNDLPPKARDIAMVFQSYALYPHMTIYNNLAFGLRRLRLKTGAVRQTVQRVAAMLELDTLLNRYPKQLSGGQKQRVALGRAMVRDPQVFLMDEPLSNLDAKLRAQTRAQIVQLQQQLGTTTIYVTHDQTEAMTMGHRIAVLSGGEIQQIAAPLDLYQKPANRFVAEFIGSPPMNFINVLVKDTTHIAHRHFDLTLPQSWSLTLSPYIGKTVTLGVRPEHLSITAHSTHSLPVEVVLVEALGHETYLSCRLEDESGANCNLQARISGQQIVRRGDRIRLEINQQHIHIFEAQDDGMALWAAHS